MTDPNRRTMKPVNPAQAGEPVVSKALCDARRSRTSSVEALAKEAAGRPRQDACARWRDGDLPAHQPEVADARVYGITGFAARRA